MTDLDGVRLKKFSRCLDLIPYWQIIICCALISVKSRNTITGFTRENAVTSVELHHCVLAVYLVIFFPLSLSTKISHKYF